MEPLKNVQVEGHLMFAEPHDLFGNLDELCYVSLYALLGSAEQGRTADYSYLTGHMLHTFHGLSIPIFAFV